MTKNLYKGQEGSVAVTVGISLVVLLGFMGLALDVGSIVATKTKMQSAVDAAAYAGALMFTSNSIPPSITDQTNATTQANTILHSNGFPSVDLTPTFPTDAVYNGSLKPAIDITMTQEIPTYFMSVLGINSLSLSARAEAVLSNMGGLPPPFNYTLYAKTRIGLNGSGNITGNIHANGEIDSNGNRTINGNIETGTDGVHKIYFNGNSHVTGYAQADIAADVVTNGPVQIDGGKTSGGANVPMPDFSQAIIDAAAATPGTTINGDLNINSGSIDSLGGNIYASGNVNINGSINWSGSIIAGGNISINGSSTLGGSNQVFLYSKTGSVYFNGSSYLGSNGSASVIVYAPNGQVNLNGSSTLHGRVYAKEINFNGSGTIDGTNGSNITVLPPGAVPGGAKKSRLVK